MPWNNFFPVLVTVSITIIRYKLNWVWWYTASNTSTEEAEAGMMVHTSNPSTEEAGLFQVSKSDLKISNTSTCECVCVWVTFYETLKCSFSWFSGYRAWHPGDSAELVTALSEPHQLPQTSGQTLLSYSEQVVKTVAVHCFPGME